MRVFFRGLGLSPARQVKLLSLLLDFYHRGIDALDRGVPVNVLIALPVVAALARAKSTFGDDEIAGLDALATRVAAECAAAGGAETLEAAS